MSGSSVPSLLEGSTRPPNERFRAIPDRERVERTVTALGRNGMTVFVEPTPAGALERVRGLLPEGSEVFTATSRTLEVSGIGALLNESGRYRSVRSVTAKMDRKTQFREMVKLGATPEYVVGSAHAVTEAGQVLVASATGSQLAPYAASAAKVVWVVGVQKIVRTLEEGLERIREYSFPLENARAQKAYGVGTSLSKILIVQKESVPGRITVVLVGEEIGF